jgi:hypothetical protein
LLSQYLEMSPHHSPKSKQLSTSGHPACLKHDATWRVQWDHAPLQDLSSSQSGRGDEHHLPHLYSHSGGTTVVLTQTELLVVVVDTTVVEVVGVVVGVSVTGGAEVDEVDVGGSSVLLETGGS